MDQQSQNAHGAPGASTPPASQPAVSGNNFHDRLRGQRQAEKNDVIALGSETELDAFGNASENSDPVSETNSNLSKSFPKEAPSVSEKEPTVSETDDNIVGFVPRPPREDRHQVTLREAEDFFAKAGFTITERTIRNWCVPNKKGQCLLDCGFDEADRKWFIAQVSLEDRLFELRGTDQPVDDVVSETEDVVSEPFPNSFGNDPGSFRSASESEPKISESFPKGEQPVSERRSEPRREQGDQAPPAEDIDEDNLSLQAVMRLPKEQIAMLAVLNNKQVKQQERQLSDLEGARAMLSRQLGHAEASLRIGAPQEYENYLKTQLRNFDQLGLGDGQEFRKEG